jgi:type I restriction enzyme S subunit
MTNQIATLDMGKKFKKTPAGEIPVEWEVATISSLCDINPSKTEIGRLENTTQVSFIRMENIIEDAGGISEIREGRLGDFINKGYTYFREGDLLFAKITPCMENGKVALAKNLKDGIGFGSTEFHVLRIDEKKILSQYLFYWVSQKSFRELAARHFRGSAGQQRVQRDFFDDAFVPIPPLPEQKKIAEILTAVDESIEKTRAVIEKTKELKKGLMQTLLTRGIGHKKFKKTPAGEIPVEWEVEQIKNLTRMYSGGTPSRQKQDYFGGGIPWVKSGELNSQFITHTEETITEEGLSNSSAKWVPENSVLVAMYGATAGQVALLKIKATINQAILAVIPVTEKLISGYLYYFMQMIAPHLISITQGSGQPNLSQEIVAPVYLVVPSLAEQKKIAEILTAVDEEIEKEESMRKTLQEQKKALMQNLLSGKVRVLIGDHYGTSDTRGK